MLWYQGGRRNKSWFTKVSNKTSKQVDPGPGLTVKLTKSVRVDTLSLYDTQVSHEFMTVGNRILFVQVSSRYEINEYLLKGIYHTCPRSLRCTMLFIGLSYSRICRHGNSYLPYYVTSQAFIQFHLPRCIFVCLLVCQSASKYCKIILTHFLVTN